MKVSFFFVVLYITAVYCMLKIEHDKTCKFIHLENNFFFFENLQNARWKVIQSNYTTSTNKSNLIRCRSKIRILKYNKNAVIISGFLLSEIRVQSKKQNLDRKLLQQALYFEYLIYFFTLHLPSFHKCIKIRSLVIIYSITLTQHWPVPTSQIQIHVQYFLYNTLPPFVRKCWIQPLDFTQLELPPSEKWKRDDRNFFSFGRASEISLFHARLRVIRPAMTNRSNGATIPRESKCKSERRVRAKRECFTMVGEKEREREREREREEGMLW